MQSGSIFKDYSNEQLFKKTSSLNFTLNHLHYITPLACYMQDANIVTFFIILLADLQMLMSLINESYVKSMHSKFLDAAYLRCRMIYRQKEI